MNKAQKTLQKTSQKMSHRVITILKSLARQHSSSMTFLNKESAHSIDLNQKAFRVLISTVLSQRNRDEMTEIASNRLFAKYDTPKKIRDAKTKDIEKLIKQSGFYRTKARRIKEISKILLEKHDGIVPDNYQELIALPGVGRKTAGCVLVYAYGQKAIPVDTHVHRISNRLGLVNTKTPEKTEQELLKIVPKNYWPYVNELFVLHGKKVCKPIRPDCSSCSIVKLCDYDKKYFRTGKF